MLNGQCLPRIAMAGSHVEDSESSSPRTRSCVMVANRYRIPLAP